MFSINIKKIDSKESLTKSINDGNILQGNRIIDQKPRDHKYESKCPYGGGLVAKLCLSLVTLRTVACQAPLSMGFSRQEYWSGLPFMVSDY